MFCATGAVACLASVIVQWSGELPVQQSHWEQGLFGDLSTPLVPQPPAAAEPAPLPQPAAAGNPSAAPILVETMPDPIGSPSARSLERLPAAASPRLIQTVRHQQPDDSPTVWLSGGIEQLNDEPTPRSEQGTRYFPDAQRE